MATSKNCSACNDLQKYAPDFVTNGVTDAVCNSLKSNTGFSTKNSRNNCTDISDANDCLIGNLADEIDGYDTCDWKDYLRRLVPNIYNVLSAITCWLCGLQKKVDKHDCEIDLLFRGQTFKIGEEETSGSYVVAGKGVSYAIPIESWDSSQLYLRLYGGAYGKMGGSYQFFTQNFTDRAASYNFDNGSTVTKSQSRQGNPIWADHNPNFLYGGELISEFRIKKSAYPQILGFSSGFGQESGGGSYHVRIMPFTEGQYAYGQHGACKENGDPWESGNSRGHLVPSGWIYLQLRMTSNFVGFNNNTQYTPNTTLAIVTSRDNTGC